MTKNYEYTYLTRQDMTEEAAKNLQDKIAQLITAKNGAVVDTPRSYKKRLAYRIKKQDVAFVNTIMFTLDAEKLATFKKETDELAEILRGLIVSYDPKKLEAEDRREPRMAEEKSEETVVVIKETVQAPAAKVEAAKTEKPLVAAKEEKIEKEEEKTVKAKKEEAKTEETKKTKKEDKPKKETKEEKEEKEEKTEETKEAKPKRRTKIKTELKDIEQKLDEILK